MNRKHNKRRLKEVISRFFRRPHKSPIKVEQDINTDTHLHFTKVVYFDASSATDYLTIKHKGIFSQTSKTISNSEVTTQISGGTSISAELNSPIFKTISLSSEIKADINDSGSSKHIIEATLTMSVMTEFIKEARKDDKNISKLDNITLKIEQDSSSFLKIISPFLSLIKDNSQIPEFENIDIAKFNDMLSQLKGYYEITTLNKKGETVVLRFNIDSFRNNYRLSDLSIMDLTYYAVKIGVCTKADLNLIPNFFATDKQTVVYDDIMLQDTTNQKGIKNIPVYDVIFAGIKESENK